MTNVHGTAVGGRRRIRKVLKRVSRRVKQTVIDIKKH